MHHDPVVIVSAKRSPIGHMLGALSSHSVTELGALVIKDILNETRVDTQWIQEVIMGCVLPAGLGQAPARQAAIKSGLPTHVGAVTINKMCGSGMKAIMFAYEKLMAQPDCIIIAGGMESMSNAPYLLKRARQGYRFGHDGIYDHMLLDGLEDAYEQKPMGWYAEETAKQHHISREAQDEYAKHSALKAKHATTNEYFKTEIVPIPSKKDTSIVTIDEGPTRINIDKIPTLKPAFQVNGTVTAANASSISDGAAALILCRSSLAQKLKLKPLASIKAYTSYASDPSLFTTAPVAAILKLLEITQWNATDVDLYEINEAFAVVALYAMKFLKLNADRLNIHGGACALGHPIGASGARILVTLIHALKQNKLKKGIASLCIGGGEATAMAIEMIQ